MPTLFRLLAVTGAVVALAYGAMWAMVVGVQPQQRVIVEAVNLPGTASDGELRTGRSVAARLESQGAALTRHRR